MISPEDVLKHAQNLFDHGDQTEIVMRNIARNAYYALYHKLLALDLPELIESDKKCGSHQQLIKRLRKSKDEKQRQLGLKLANLKYIRVKADYLINDDFTEDSANESLEKVKSSFKKMKINTEEIIEVVKSVEPNKKRQPLKVVK